MYVKIYLKNKLMEYFFAIGNIKKIQAIYCSTYVQFLTFFYLNLNLLTWSCLRRDCKNHDVQY
jgi:hypothetical protein